MEQIILKIINRGKIHEMTAHELSEMFAKFWQWTLMNCTIIEIMGIKSWKCINRDGGVILYADSKDLFLYYYNNIYKK